MRFNNVHLYNGMWAQTVENVNQPKEYLRKITNYGHGRYEVVTYADPQIRLTGELHKGGANPNSEISDAEQEMRTKHQMYAIKRRIRGLALCNPFKWFVTMTINPKRGNRFDYDLSKTMLLKWCRLMRDRYGKLEYLIVPELHKSGAVHFHGLLGDVPANFVQALNPRTQEPIVKNGKEVYNLQDWDAGFSLCEQIASKERTASYITKYITKDLMNNKEMFRKKRYFNSQGLKRPKVTYDTVVNPKMEYFTPNFAVIQTNQKGTNRLYKAVYHLSVDSETLMLAQPDQSYLFKAKSDKKRAFRRLQLR